LYVNRNIFVAPTLDYNDYLQVFQGRTQIASHLNRSTSEGLDLGSQFTKYGELRVGLVGGPRTYTLNSGPSYRGPRRVVGQT
jgi:NTE family protein